MHSIDDPSLTKVGVEVGWPSTVLVKRIHGEGGKPRMQSHEQSGSGSIQNKGKKEAFKYIFLYYRGKNKVDDEQKKTIMK